MLVDERPARGGADAGAMPFEYLLASLLEICEKTPVTLAVRAGVPIQTTLQA